MAWIFLGVVTIPFAAVAYFAFQRVLPRLLEPVPEVVLVEGAEMPVQRGSRFGPRLTTGIRLGAISLAVVVVAIAAIKARPTAAPGAAGGPVAAANAQAQPQVQLPAATPLTPTVRFGSDGTGAAQMHDPRDIAVDPSGNIWVADTGNKRLLKFKPDGTPLGQWTTSAQGSLSEPSSLVATKDGIVLVDSETAMLHKYDFNGQPVSGFEHDLHLGHPRGIAIDSKGNLYVASTATNSVVKVNPDGTPAGTIPNLEQPSSLAVDDQGDVYIGQPDTRRLDKLGPDGALLGRFSLPASTTLLPPRLLNVPGKGLLAAAPNENLLLQYAANGTVAASWSVPGADAAPPQRPMGLALAPDGKSLWVVWNASSTVTQLPLPA